MIRRLAVPVIAVVVPLAIVVLAGWPIVTSHRWLNRRALELLTVGVAQLLGMEIRAGAIEGDPFRGVSIRDVAILDPRPGAEPVASAREVRVSYDLWAVLKGQAQPAESIREVRVTGLRARLVRGPDGKLNIDRALQLLMRRQPARGRFRGRVIVDDAEVQYTDFASRPAWLSGVEVGVTSLAGEVDFANPDLVRWRAKGVGALAPVGPFEAEGTIAPKGRAVSGQGVVEGVDLPALYARFARRPGVRLRSGVANAWVSFCVIPGDFADYAVAGRAEGLSAEVAALGGNTVTGSAEFSATPAGVQLADVHARALGAEAEGHGVVFGAPAASIDIQGVARGVDARRWAEFVPQVRESLPDVTGLRSVRVAGRVSGPLTHLNLALAAQAPQPVAVAYSPPVERRQEGAVTPARLVTAAARGLAVQAMVPDLPSGDMVVRVAAEELRVGDLARLLPQQDYLRLARPEPLRNVSGRLYYSRRTAASGGWLKVGAIDTEYGELRGVDVHYALAGKALRLNVQVDNALGAEVGASGLVDLRGKTPAVYAQFDARAVDAATAASVAGWRRPDLRGTLALEGVLATADGRLQAAAHVSGSGVGVGGFGTDEAAANVGVTNDGVKVRYATAKGPLGAWWVKGWVPFHGASDLEFTVTDVPVAEAATALGRQRSGDASREPQGTLYAHGRLRGNLDRPALEADLAAFGVGVGKQRAQVATAALSATKESVRLANVRLRRGTATAVGDVALTEIQWPPGSPLSAPDRQPGYDHAAIQPTLPDGHLSGTARVTGFDLSQLAEFVNLPEGLRLTGVTSCEDIAIGGTLQAPTAKGSMAVTDSRVVLADLAVAMGPVDVGGTFEADRNAVRMQANSSPFAEPALQTTAEISGWNAEEGTQITGTFSARAMPLVNVMPRQGILRGVEGTLRVSDGRIAGPVGGPGPTLSAALSADAVAFGRRDITKARATISYADGAWRLQGGECLAAGGTIHLPTAAYWPKENRLEAEADARGLRAEELLFWAGDIARAAAKDAGAGAGGRDRLYSLAHRIRGSIDLGSLKVAGPLGNLSGSVASVTTSDGRIDTKGIPDLEAGTGFTGLDLSTTEPSPGEDRPGAAPKTRLERMSGHLRLDDLSVQGELDGGAISAQGTVDLGGEVDVTAAADMVPFGALEPWLPMPVELGGRMSIDAQARGPAKNPDIKASVDVLEPVVAGKQFDLLQVTSIEVRQNVIAVDGATLTGRQGQVVASARLPFDRPRLRLDPEGQMRFETRVTDLPLPVAFELLHGLTQYQRPRGGGGSVWQQCEAEGVLTAWVRMFGKLKEPRVGGGVYVNPGATFRLRSWPEAVKLRDVVVDSVFSPSPTGVGAIVEALNVEGRLDNALLSLRGRAEVTHLAPDRLLDNRVEELVVTAVTPESKAQRLPGGAQARNLDAAVRIFTDPLGWQVARVDHATAKLGKGDARLSGSLLLDALDPRALSRSPCSLRLDLHDAGVQWDGGYVRSGRLNGTIAATKFVSPSGRPLPSWFLAERTAPGPTEPKDRIRLASVSTKDRWESAPIVLSDARLDLPPPPKPRKGEVIQKPESSAVVGGGRSLSGWPRQWPGPDLDVSLAVGRDVRIDNRTFQADLVRNPQAVTLAGTPQAPDLHVSIAVSKGTLRLLRGNLGVSEGGADVQIRPALGKPVGPTGRTNLVVTGRVWGRAEGTVNAATSRGQSLGSVRVVVELSGGLPPDHVLTASSTPSLSEDEIKSLLAFGRSQPGERAAGGQQASSDDLLASLVGRQLLETVLGPLEQEVSSALGLSEFSLQVGVNEPVEFRVGKYIVKGLLLSYRRTSGGPRDQYDLNLSYEVRPKVTVTLHTDERSEKDLRVQYRWTF